jgi:Fe-S-cluster containining protein
MIEPLFKSLATLYDTMDTAWNKVAAAYHFQCNGCADNCCKSLFFHHTYIERDYLRHGIKTLAQDSRHIILDKAERYCKKTFHPAGETKSLKIYCPANDNHCCLLYAYRPMICRLHGLPHELSRPGLKPIISKGCAAGLFDNQPYIRFDRTPFYQQMAQIEMTYRQTVNKTDKVKQTVAQMLLLK